MNPVRSDSPATEFRPPNLPAASDDGDLTLVRGRPPLIPASDVDDDDDVRDSPIARLILSQERPHAQQHSSLPGVAPARKPSSAPGLPVTLLTSDPLLASQIRGALEGASEVTVVATADEAAALAAAGKCPVLVTDTVLTRSAIEALKTRLRSHDPALSFIVAGNRDQGGLCIGLQSSGAIDGFLLKPVTAGATQLVVESATKRYRAVGAEGDIAPEPTRRSRTRPPRATRPPAGTHADAAEGGIPTIETRVAARTHHIVAPAVDVAAQSPRTMARPSWLLMIAAAALVGGIVWWVMWQRIPAIDPQQVIAQHLSQAASAQDAGRWIGARESAAFHYQTVLALDPVNLAAQRGMDRVAAELSKRTQLLMSERRLAEAALALERLRETQPDYAELPLLDSQLKLLQDSVLATLSPPAPAQPEAEKRDEPVPAARERSATRTVERAPPPERPRSTESAAMQKPSNADSNPVTSVAKPAAVEPPATKPIAPAQATTTPAPNTPVVTPAATPSPTPAPAPTLQASNTPPSAAPTDTAQPVPAATSPALPAASTPASNALTRAAGEGPALTKYVPPAYPTEAYSRGIEGWVQVNLKVSPGGSVLSAQVVDGEKRQLFSRSALAAVKQWRYESRPYASNEAALSVRLDFKLDR